MNFCCILLLTAILCCAGCYGASLQSAACLTSLDANSTTAMGGICNTAGLGGYVFVTAGTFQPITHFTQVSCNGTRADLNLRYNFLGCCRHTSDLIGCLIFSNSALDQSCPSGKMCCDNDNNGRFDICDDFCN